MRYTISFYLGHQDPLALGYAGPLALDFVINQDAPIAFTNLEVVSQDVAWKQFAYTFIAPTNLTTFAFINRTSAGNATTPGNNYAGLDNVVLVAVPEPGTLALFGVGFGVLLLRRRRKIAPT